MNPIKKGNLFLIFVVVLISFTIGSSVALMFQPDLGLNTNDTSQMLIVGDENFEPATVNTIKTVNDTNTKNKTTPKTNKTQTNNSIG